MSDPCPGDTTQQFKDQLFKEQQLRRRAEEQFRSIDAKHKRLEIELNRYREHFESLVASRTAELMAINEKLIQENRERRMAERERRSFQDQLHEASLLLEATLDAIPDIIGVQDTQCNILRFNKAGYEFFGMKEDQVVGKRSFELIDEAMPSESWISQKYSKHLNPSRWSNISLPRKCGWTSAHTPYWTWTGACSGLLNIGGISPS